jgi:ubiquitin-like protein ATG12
MEGAAAAEDPIADGKIVVLFRNTGRAPQLKQKKFKLSTQVRFGYVVEFLRKQLRFKAEDALFLFVSGTFQPHPDETVEDLYRCFRDAVGGKLVVNYSTEQAWG